VPERRNFLDKDALYDGDAAEFPALDEAISSSFAMKNLYSMLEPLAINRPQLPQLYTPPVGVVLTFDQQRYNAQIRAERTKIIGMYTMATSLIMSKLKGAPRTDCSQFLINRTANPLDTYDEVRNALYSNYGQNTDVAIMELRRRVETCPRVLTHEEAALFIALIGAVNHDLQVLDPARILSEPERRTTCIQKLGPLFESIVEKIEGDPMSQIPPLTWAQISKMLRQRRELARIRTTAVYDSSLPSRPTPSSVTQAGDTSIEGATDSLVQNASGQFCNNCGSSAHYIRDCDTFCKMCSGNSQRRHHPNDCNQRQQRTPGSQRNRYSAQRGRQDRGSRGPPRKDLYGETTTRARSASPAKTVGQRRSVNEVYGVLFDHEDDYLDDEEYDDSQDYAYQEDDAEVYMAVAQFSTWDSSFLEAHACLSAALVCQVSPPVHVLRSRLSMCLQRLRVVAECFSFRQQLAAIISAKSVVSNLVTQKYVPGTWSRYVKPRHLSRTETTHRWLNRDMEHALNMDRSRRRCLHKGRRRLMKSIRGRRVVPLQSDLPRSNVPGRSLTRSYWRTKYSGRRYLEECVHYRSVRRGRGRGHAVSWWSGRSRRVTSQDHCRSQLCAPSLACFGLPIPPRTWLMHHLTDSWPRQPIVCNMADKLDQSRSLSQGMLDTGANLSISHPQLATMLGVTPIDWPRPIPIRYGNSSDDVSKQYIDLGPLLGRVALVESAQSTIITKKALLKCGLSIVLRSDHVCRLIRESTEEVVFELALADPDDFFMIPLQVLLPPSMRVHLNTYLNGSPSSDGPGDTSLAVQVNGRRALPVVTAAEIDAVMSLHQRMYHPSSAVMAQALRDGAWTGVDISPTLVERVFNHRDCLFCALGKMKRVPRLSGSRVKPVFGDEISVDYLPISTVARGNFKGAYVLVERASGYAWAYLTRTNNANWFVKAVCHVRTCLLKHQFKLRVVRTDAGKVEASQEAATKLAEFHIEVNSAAPEAQYQNFVERFIQTAVRGIATTLVAQQFLDNSFWGMALLAWIRAWNCRPNQSSDQFTPEFHLTGRHPDISLQFQYAFGSSIVSRVLNSSSRTKKEEKFKFQPTGELGYVVGNTHSGNGASLIFFPNKGSNVAFPRVDIRPIAVKGSLSDRELAQHLDKLSVTEDDIKLPERDTPPSPLSPAKPRSDSLPEEVDTSAVNFDSLAHSEALQLTLQEPHLPPAEITPLSLEDGPATEEVMEGSSIEQEDEPTTVESMDVEEASSVVEPEYIVEEVSDPEDLFSGKRTRTGRVYHAKRASPAGRDSDMPSLAVALKSERAAEWEESIRVEIKALLDHNTGTEVALSDIKSGAQILPVKVVLKLKRDTTGAPIKYKARLCVLGNLVKKTLTSVFAPTANAKSLMLLLAIATTQSLAIKSIDVYGAFLYPTQKEETFIHIPPSITGDRDVFWRLNKTMYGLPSSPKAFYEHVSAHLLKCGYSRCASDPCFFWKRIGGGFLFAVVHVDDFVIAASTEDLILQFINDLEKVYVVSVSNDVNHFLGIHITEFPSGERLLSQPGLMKRLLAKFPEVTQVTKFPAVPMRSTFDDAIQKDAPACDETVFRELLGGLLYGVKTRPDIGYAVNRMAMRSKEATERDLNSLKRILAYVYNTQSIGIRLVPMHSAEFVLECWCDAAYAVHPDGKSQTGYGFKCAGSQSGLFYSRSTKQTNVALSSTEAELNAAFEAVKDVVWFRELLAELGFIQSAPTVVYVDNASLITLASQYSGNHKRVKHFLVRLNFLIDQVKNGVVNFVKVHTDDNVADCLTKPLGPTALIPKRDSLLGMSL
jgi:hypothetical protein